MVKDPLFLELLIIFGFRACGFKGKVTRIWTWRFESFNR